jgi:hypothetical protein
MFISVDNLTTFIAKVAIAYGCGPDRSKANEDNGPASAAFGCDLCAATSLGQ